MRKLCKFFQLARSESRVSLVLRVIMRLRKCYARVINTGYTMWSPASFIEQFKGKIMLQNVPPTSLCKLMLWISKAAFTICTICLWWNKFLSCFSEIELTNRPQSWKFRHWGEHIPCGFSFFRTLLRIYSWV